MQIFCHHMISWIILKRQTTKFLETNLLDAWCQMFRKRKFDILLMLGLDIKCKLAEKRQLRGQNSILLKQYLASTISKYLSELYPPLRIWISDEAILIWRLERFWYSKKKFCALIVVLKSFTFEGLRILVCIEREIKSFLFLNWAPRNGGGLITGRVVVVESDLFGVQKLFRCRLAGASAG